MSALRVPARRKAVRRQEAGKDQWEEDRRRQRRDSPPVITAHPVRSGTPRVITESVYFPRQTCAFLNGRPMLSVSCDRGRGPSELLIECVRSGGGRVYCCSHRRTLPIAPQRIERERERDEKVRE